MKKKFLKFCFEDLRKPANEYWSVKKLENEKEIIQRKIEEIHDEIAKMKNLYTNNNTNPVDLENDETTTTSISPIPLEEFAINPSQIKKSDSPNSGSSHSTESITFGLQDTEDSLTITTKESIESQNEIIEEDLEDFDTYQKREPTDLNIEDEDDQSDFIEKKEEKKEIEDEEDFEEDFIEEDFMEEDKENKKKHKKKEKTIALDDDVFLILSSDEEDEEEEEERKENERKKDEYTPTKIKKKKPKTIVLEDDIELVLSSDDESSDDNDDDSDPFEFKLFTSKKKKVQKKKVEELKEEEKKPETIEECEDRISFLEKKVIDLKEKIWIKKMQIFQNKSIKRFFIPIRTIVKTNDILNGNFEEREVIELSDVLLTTIAKQSDNIYQHRKEILKLEKKLFPKGIEQNKDYQTKFLKFLNDFNVPDLKKFFREAETTVSTSNLLKNEFIDWIYCKLFDFTTRKEKRKMEGRNLKGFRHDAFFYKLGSKRNGVELIVPFDVMEVIVSFLNKDLRFINSFGLVNEAYYLLALESFRSIIINKTNCMNIPILVLNNVTSIDLYLSHHLYVKNIRHIFNHLKNIKKLHILTNNQRFIEKFVSAVTKPKINLSMIHSLQFSESGNITHLDFEWIGNCFPGIKRLYNVRSSKFLKYKKKIKIETLDIGEWKYLSLPKEKLNVIQFIDATELKELKIPLNEDTRLRGIKIIKNNVKTLRKLELKYFPDRKKKKAGFKTMINALSTLQNLEELSLEHSYEPNLRIFSFLDHLKNLRLFVLKQESLLGFTIKDDLRLSIFEQGTELQTINHNKKKMDNFTKIIVPHLQSFNSVSFVFAVKPESYFNYDYDKIVEKIKKYCNSNNLVFYEQNQNGVTKRKILENPSIYFTFLDKKKRCVENSINPAKNSPYFYDIVHINYD